MRSSFAPNIRHSRLLCRRGRDKGSNGTDPDGIVSPASAAACCRFAMSRPDQPRRLAMPVQVQPDRPTVCRGSGDDVSGRFILRIAVSATMGAASRSSGWNCRPPGQLPVPTCAISALHPVRPRGSSGLPVHSGRHCRSRVQRLTAPTVSPPPGSWDDR